MAKTKLLRWINTPSQIVELTTMLRQGFAEAPDEQRPTTREIGCLDAPQILPVGAVLAAALDLLDAAKLAADTMAREDFGTLTVLPILQAAIAKAEGQS
jgi:hypothetical protein